MNIFIHDESCAVAEASSLGTVLAGRDLLDKRGIAVAVNNQVISRRLWPDHPLRENDRIIIITATQGG